VFGDLRQILAERSSPANQSAAAVVHPALSVEKASS
jgi:hypothetical protein